MAEGPPFHEEKKRKITNKIAIILMGQNLWDFAHRKPKIEEYRIM